MTNKKSNIVFIIILCIGALVLISRYLHFDPLKLNIDIYDVVKEVCDGEYSSVLESKKYHDRGIFECKKDNYVYYIETQDTKCGLYECGKVYEFGYSKYDDVEKYFPNEKYFYRKSGVVGIPNELKIFLKADSDEELIDTYAPTMYEFMKSLNDDNFRRNKYFI